MDRNESIVNPYAKSGARREGSPRLDRSGGHDFAPEPPHSLEPYSSSISTALAAEKSPTGGKASALVIAASDKAGMEGIDRKRIDKIIMRASGDSLYMQQQRKRDEKVNSKIAALQELLATKAVKDPSWRNRMEREIDQEVPAILSQRPARSTCVVVDMDMFFMACELLARPELVHKPACVGGSMISTSNYVARRYGVRSAMAGYIGDKLVHELSNGREKLIHVPHNFELYRQKSEIVRGVLAEYDPGLSAYSLDEVYLNLNSYLAIKLQHQDWGHERIKSLLQTNHACLTDNDSNSEKSVDDESSLDSADEFLSGLPTSVCVEAVEVVVKEMRSRVTRETGGLTCSAGVAPNFMLAKIASDRNKPDGQLVVGSHQEQIVEFLHPLPTRKISGIGRVQEKILSAFMVFSVSDLYEQRALVRLLFTPITATFLLHASLGCSSSNASSSSEDTGQKGVSRERTFQPIHSWSEINVRLEDIGKLLSDDMKRKDLWGQTVSVKVKLLNYDVLSKSRTLPNGAGVQACNDLVDIAASLLSKIRLDLKGSQFSVRLLGIRCSNFVPRDADQNRESFDDPNGVASRRQTRAPLVTLDRFITVKKKNLLGFHSQEEPPAQSSPAMADSGITGDEIDQIFNDKIPRSVLMPSDGVPPKESLSTRTQTKSSVQLVSCPLCGCTFSEVDNLALNRHIDSCLNVVAVREVLHGSHHTTGTKRKRISDYFARQR
jgi:DNA polymerase kappa